jgi:hypothetical protein
MVVGLQTQAPILPELPWAPEVVLAAVLWPLPQLYRVDSDILFLWCVLFPCLHACIWGKPKEYRW